MKEITLLEILFVTFLLIMPIISGYLTWRIFKLYKRIKQLQDDRNKLLEKRTSDIPFQVVRDGEKAIGQLLSDMEKRMILNALGMGEYKNWVEDPKTPHLTRKIYRELLERLKESMKD